MENPPPLPSSAVLHKGSKGAGANISDMISDHPCSNLYYLLENCLGEKDRDWRQCQSEVAALKHCNAKRPKAKK